MRTGLVKTGWASLLVAAIALTGCGQFKELSAESIATRNAIRTELGVDAQVAFRSFSGTSGKKVFVSVRLSSTPPGEAAAIKMRVESIVKSHFKEPVDRVDVTM